MQHFQPAEKGKSRKGGGGVEESFSSINNYRLNIMINLLAEAVD